MIMTKEIAQKLIVNEMKDFIHFMIADEYGNPVSYQELKPEEKKVISEGVYDHLIAWLNTK